MHAFGLPAKDLENRTFEINRLVHLEPKETKQVEVLFHSHVAKVKENSAILIGQISPPPANQNAAGIFSRKGGSFGPTFKIDLSAIIQGTSWKNIKSVLDFWRISYFQYYKLFNIDLFCILKHSICFSWIGKVAFKYFYKISISLSIGNSQIENCRL